MDVFGYGWRIYVHKNIYYIMAALDIKIKLDGTKIFVDCCCYWWRNFCQFSFLLNSILASAWTLYYQNPNRIIYELLEGIIAEKKIDDPIRLNLPSSHSHRKLWNPLKYHLFPERLSFVHLILCSPHFTSSESEVLTHFNRSYIILRNRGTDPYNWFAMEADEAIRQYQYPTTAPAKAQS